MAVRKPRYRDVTVVVTMRVHRDMSTREAKVELKTRVNALCAYYDWLASGACAEDSHLTVKRVTVYST